MRRSKTLKKAELNKIRKHMPYRWQKQVAQEAGKSVSMVNQVMCGCNNNALIVAKAIDLCGLTEREKTFLKSKLLFIHESN